MLRFGAVRCGAVRCGTVRSDAEKVYCMYCTVLHISCIVVVYSVRNMLQRCSGNGTVREKDGDNGYTVSGIKARNSVIANK